MKKDESLFSANLAEFDGIPSEEAVDGTDLQVSGRDLKFALDLLRFINAIALAQEMFDGELPKSLDRFGFSHQRVIAALEGIGIDLSTFSKQVFFNHRLNQSREIVTMLGGAIDDTLFSVDEIIESYCVPADLVEERKVFLRNVFKRLIIAVKTGIITKEIVSGALEKTAPRKNPFD